MQLQLFMFLSLAVFSAFPDHTAIYLYFHNWKVKTLNHFIVSWQIIELSRDYFGMSNLEKTTELGGSLSVRIGDALSPSATVEGGFAGEHFIWCKHNACFTAFLEFNYGKLSSDQFSMIICGKFRLSVIGLVIEYL